MAQVGRQVGPKLPPGGVSARAEIKACAETLVVAPKWLQVASKLAKVGSKLAHDSDRFKMSGTYEKSDVWVCGINVTYFTSLHAGLVQAVVARIAEHGPYALFSVGLLILSVP